MCAPSPSPHSTTVVCFKLIVTPTHAAPMSAKLCSTSFLLQLATLRKCRVLLKFSRWGFPALWHRPAKLLQLSRFRSGYRFQATG